VRPVLAAGGPRPTPGWSIIARFVRSPSLAAIVDQGVYSLTNFILLATVARASDVDAFGQFSAIYLAYVLLLSLLRAIGGQPLLYEPTTTITFSKAWVATAVAGSALLLGLSGALTTSEAGLLAVTLVPVGFQDVLRYVLFSSRSGSTALVSDGAWLAIQICILVALEVTGRAGAIESVAAWSAGAVLAGAVALILVRHQRVPGNPSPQPHVPSGGRGAWFIVDSLVAFVRSQGYVLLFAAFVGWDGAGAMRMGFTVFGFVPVVVIGLVSSFLPLMSGGGGAGRPTPRIVRNLHLVSMGMGGLATLLIVLAAASGFLESFFGTDTWDLTAPLFAWIAIVHVCFLLQAPSQLLHMGYVGLDQAVRGKALAALVSLCGVATGLWLADSATGGVVGMAGAEIATLVAWRVSWRRFAIRSEQVNTDRVVIS